MITYSMFCLVTSLNECGPKHDSLGFSTSFLGSSFLGGSGSFLGVGVNVTDAGVYSSDTSQIRTLKVVILPLYGLKSTSYPRNKKI